jgi:hypothetical protein
MESGRQLSNNFFLSYAKGDAWWYIILMNDKVNSSLANLFGITTEQLKRLLTLRKLLSVYTGEYRLNINAFERFIFEYYLDVEFKKKQA